MKSNQANIKKTALATLATALVVSFGLGSGRVAVAAQPDHLTAPPTSLETMSGQTMPGPGVILVPPGCGSYSGQPLPPGWTLDDHSNDAVALGDILGAPHRVAAVFGMITIGTPYPDHIQGNAVDEVICGLDGYDWIKGGSGDDEIFGGLGADSLSGEEGSDFLSGGPDGDVLFGDDSVGSHSGPGGFDLADTIQGGDGDDYLYGGAGSDILRGGANSDYADGGVGADTCTGTENGPC